MNAHTTLEKLAYASTIGVFRVARRVPPAFLNSQRKFESLTTLCGRRHWETLEYRREFQSLRCWELHSKVYWAKREPLFCLPAASPCSEENDQSNGGYGSASERESNTYRTEDDTVMGITDDQSEEIDISQGTMAMAESGYITGDCNFCDQTSEILNACSSAFSIALDEIPSRVDGEIKEKLLLEVYSDFSESKPKNLQTKMKEHGTSMTLERFFGIDGGETGSGCCVLSPTNLLGNKDRKGRWFPYTDQFKLGDVILSSSDILHVLDPHILETRKKRIREVVRNRSYSVCLVVEGLTDFGNISAVFRSADALGFQSVHVISNDSNKRYRQNRNVSRGAEKWLDIEQWKSTRECFEVLRSRGYQIAVTHIGSNAVSVHNMDWTLPTAIVVGNEHKGISEEALQLSDMKCSIPMTGMVDSFNVSVAAGILMYIAVRDRISRLIVRILAGVDPYASGVDSGDEEGWTPLHSAVSSGRTNVVQTLLQSGADVSLANKGGRTALHYAASKGWSKLAQILISHGAKVNQKDKVGCTPLHRAAGTGHPELCELLIEEGADVDTTDKTGQTPLMHATICNDKQVALLLVRHGADVDHEDNEGYTVLGRASDELRPMLIDAAKVMLEG